MKFSAPLLEGVLLRRHHRFLADVRLVDGTLVTAHTANTGAMTGCCTPGARVWLSRSNNPRRKYPYTWELVEAAPGNLVGINTGLANRLVREAIEKGVIQELQGYDRIHQERPFGEEQSRIDLLLEDAAGRHCYVEVKNVTLMDEGIGFFPDAVSHRGTKHLRELVAMTRRGMRGVILFCVQREDVREVRPADTIDPTYGRTLREALAQGVEALACDCRISTRAIEIRRTLPVRCAA